MGKIAKVEGEYTYMSGKVQMCDFFEEEFEFSDEVSELGIARSMLHAGLCAERLRKKHKGFRRVRTCQVVEFKDTDKKSTASQSEYEKLLVEATKLSCVPDGLENYASETSRSKALEKAIKVHKDRMTRKKKKKKDGLEGVLEPELH